MTDKDEKPAKKTSWHKRDTSKPFYCCYCGQQYFRWDSDRHKAKSSLYCSASCRMKAMNARRNNPDVDVSPMPIRDVDVSNSNQLTKNKELGITWKEAGEHWERVAVWWANRQANEKKRIAQKDSAYTTVASEGRSIIINGFGTGMSVKQDRLIIRCGMTHSTQEIQPEILYRGIHGISSIVWITNGGDGSLSIASMKWCASQNISIIILTNHGEHIATIHPFVDSPQALGYAAQDNGRADIKLRRAQYNLQVTGKDIPLARVIILRKLEAQRKCLESHLELPDRNRGFEAIDTATKWLSVPTPTPATNDLNGIRLFEARASQGYFGAWQGLPLRIDAKAEKNWATEWKYVGQRKSHLTRFMSPQNAVTPINAILNFCYAILESQIRIALHAIGADIYVGILHSDKEARENLVYDAMEGLRGEIDHLVLEFIKAHVFSVGDFNVQVSGVISIHPSLCKILAEMVKVSQRRADNEVRWLKREIMG